ncbi:unnamed protein product, partial [Symbiodinium sp. KB8]
LSVQECADPGSWLKNVQQIQATAQLLRLLPDGSVVIWGGEVVLCRLSAQECAADPGAGSHLKNVQHIEAQEYCAADPRHCAAFAAILGDSSVVTWGCHRHGGDISAVQGQLQNVMPRFRCPSW